jgi:hypothetical protein
MKKFLIPTLMILIGFIALSFTPAKDGVALRLNPKKGATYTIKTKASLMNLMEVQGQSMSMTQIIESRQTFSAKELNAEEVTIEGKTEAMKLTISQMGMTLTYDSEHPEKTSPMLAEQTEALSEELNKVKTAKFDLLGNMIEAEGDDEANLAQVNAIIPLPTEPVEVGSTWTFENKQAAGSTEINATMTYTVTKISKKSIDLNVKGVVSADEINGSYEGTASLNPQTGLLITSSIKQNISMTVSEQGMTIPLTMTGTTTITVE